MKSSWLSRKTPMKRVNFKRPIHRAGSLDTPVVVDSARQDPPDPALPKSPPRKRSHAADPISRATTKAVRERAEDCCEACRMWLGPDHGHRHHRQKRRFGNHGPENVCLLCPPCHVRAHANKDGEAWARGWVVKQWEDPALIPFIRWDEPKFTEKLR